MLVPSKLQIPNEKLNECLDVITANGESPFNLDDAKCVIMWQKLVIELKKRVDVIN